MSADLLLNNFHAIAEAPNGTQNLRELILRLAFQGKLVPQDSHDRQASELLERMKKEKDRLVKERKLKRSESLPPISDKETPYQLPEDWIWARLAEVAHDWGQKVPDERFTYIDVSSIDKARGVVSEDVKILDDDEAPSRARRIVVEGTVIYSTVRPYLLNTAIIENKIIPEPIVSTAFAVLHPYTGLENRYLHYYLRSKTFTNFVSTEMTGMAYPAISETKLQFGPVPLPPTNEQRRIVAKVDQLMALCDELEKRQEKKHQVTVQLNESALNKLTAARTEEELDKHWQRIKRNFDLLYDTPENVGKLKLAILQLAVQGKLVPQDPKDEPASVLLKRIRDEKERLIREKKIKPSKPLPPISPDEVPFELPKRWVWATLGEIATRVQIGPFGSQLHKRDYVKGGIPIVNPTHIKEEKILPKDVSAIDKTTAARLSQYLMQTGDVVMGRRGEMGKCALVTEKENGWLCGSGSLFIRTTDSIKKRYLLKLLTSEYTRTYLLDNSVGTTMDNLNQQILFELPVPLPPMNEQERISDRVDSLLQKCETLHEKLRQTLSAAERIAEAVVREA